MFDSQYRFKGRHAYRVDRLVSAFDGKSKASLFKRNIDVYLTAPLVGFLYGRRADLDNTKDPEKNQVYDENVMGDMVTRYSPDLMFNFAMIMLLDDEYEPDEEKRIDKAFRYAGKNPEDEKRFQEFVRGGVDVLYEKLIEGTSEPEDYINNLYDFVEDFYERFYEEVDIDKITKLCSSR